MIRSLALTLILSTAAVATAAPFDLNTTTNIVVPSFRGAANTTWTGWEVWNKDVFDFEPDGIPDLEVINDNTPDIGTHAGSFKTTNNEDHVSGSGNYYAAGLTVAEEVTFTTPTGGPGGFTTVIVQGVTAFGAWSNDVTFGAIDGVSPTLEVMELTNNNAADAGQFFVKYEIPGTITDPKFTLSADPGHTSIGRFVVDAVWSADGYAADTAVHIPEPTSAVIALLGIAGTMLRRRS